MPNILKNLNTTTIPGPFKVEVPRGYQGLQDSISGILELSRIGYVYSAPSKKVVWIKFLALAVSLPIKAVVLKCIDIAKQCFGQRTSHKGPHDVSHMCNLSAIAWRGVVGLTPSLMDSVEEFALAEMDYNRNGMDLMDMSRSQRFSKGFYTAKCMQPLFHQSQHEPSVGKAIHLSGKIERVGSQEKDLLEALMQKQKQEQEGASWTDSVLQYFSSSPHKDKSVVDIEKELDAIQKKKQHLQKLQDNSERCEKYAAQAIFSQQCCPHAKEQFVETQAEVRCCGEVCYKQQRICGLLYKIDCCATRCWALDCLCCVCCIWPEGRQTCII